MSRRTPCSGPGCVTLLDRRTPGLCPACVARQNRPPSRWPTRAAMVPQISGTNAESYSHVRVSVVREPWRNEA